jgi:hypothetical protein
MKFFALAAIVLTVSAANIKKETLAQTKVAAHSKVHAKAHTKAKISAKAKLLSMVNTKEGDCESGPGVDSFGDACDWYAENPSGCGNYDTEDWAAEDACCACGGGSGGCSDDMSVADSFGDDCTWYDANPSGCGGYDTADFVSSDACIACGACEGAGAAAADGDCEDGEGVDSFGDGCDWYDANPSGCGSYDTADFVAASECCGCE